MKISYQWLKKYLAVDLSPEKASEILTSTGLEVEGVEEIFAVPGGLKGIVVGEVTSCEQHPNADKLRVTEVNLGDKTVQIVCGAPNVAKGQKVPVATVGSTVHPSEGEAFKIKKGKLRGEVSEGMICAEDELSIGTSHDGIMVLPNTAVPGTPLAEELQLESDYLIEIGLTPNRTDALGHYGVARDLYAYLQTHDEKNCPELTLPSFENHSAPAHLNVEVTDQEAAPKYFIAELDVKVGPSPQWLKDALITIGLKPKNNVVDVANYVLHALGTPLHTFDASSFDQNVVVKRATAGTKITTLDEVERTLHEDDLVIANDKEALCLAGVMGGLNSGVNEKTTRIVLEAAYFNPVVIRKMAKRHAINSDASFRFERGVDHQMVAHAFNYAIELLKECADAKVTAINQNQNNNLADIKVSYDIAKGNRLIGQDIPEAMVKKILTALDISITSENNGVLDLAVPAYRMDVTRPADIVEEIIRIYGFDNIALPEKFSISINKWERPSVDELWAKTSDFLVANGCFESMNNSLTAKEYYTALCPEQEGSHVEMLNPLSKDLNIMRRNLLFGQLEVIKRNINQQNKDLKTFELGKVYAKYQNYEEGRRLILTGSGKKHPNTWNAGKEELSFFDWKGLAEGLISRLGLSNQVMWKALKENALYADGLELTARNKTLGTLAYVNDATLKHFDINQAVYVLDLDWEYLIQLVKTSKIKIKELPKTQAVYRDLSLLLDKEVRFQDLALKAQKKGGKLLKEVNLFDVYEGKNLPNGKKSYAVSFKLHDEEKTLTDKVIDKTMSQIIEVYQKEFNAELR